MSSDKKPAKKAPAGGISSDYLARRGGVRFKKPEPEPKSKISPIDALLTEYRERIRRSQSERNVDTALCSLLTRFKDELPALDGYFHKCFRQCDTVDSQNGKYIDSAIHALLYESSLFWRLFEKHRIDND